MTPPPNLSRRRAFRAPRPWPAHHIAAFVLALGVLAGCGQVPPVPTPTVPAGPGGGDAAGIPGDATINQGIPNVTAEARPPKTTLGDLAGRMDAAWSGVRSFRMVHTGPEAAMPLTREPAAAPPASTPQAGAAATPGATPVAATPVAGAAGPRQSILDVAAPDRVRQVISGTGDTDHEAMVLGDEVYLRGPFTASIVPGTPPDAWIVLPADAVRAAASDEHSPVAMLAALLMPPPSPLATLPPNLLPQEPRDLGAVEVDGRACRAWGAANTTRTGERLDITIAIDGDGLPCSIETRKGTEVQGLIVWEAFGEEIAIEAPAAATPVAAPMATPMAGHD